MNTLSTTHLKQALTCAFVIALLAPLAQGEDPPKTKRIEAGGLTFSIPEAWTTEKPGGMRKAQIKVKPVEGDADSAELLVYEFPGGAGTEEANISRWEKFFEDKDGKTPKADVKKLKGKNVEVTRVEVFGRYVAPIAPNNPERNNKAEYRFLGAIAPGSESSFYIRMVGPEKTMKAIAKDFDRMCESMNVR